MVSFLIEKGFLSGNINDYYCSGKRTIKATKENNDYVYKIICDCSNLCGNESSPDFMLAAKNYKNIYFEKHKEQLFNYYELLLKMDHSRYLFMEQANLITPGLSPEYKGNVLAQIFGIYYSSFQFNFQNSQKLIDDFVKKHEK